MPPSSASSSFPPGTKVEARFNEVWFQGAWFEATVIKYASKKRRYTVTLDSLVTEDNPPKPLEETVFYTFVRPRPPGGRRSLFKLHQLVEAYHNDGWWKGVVIEVPRGADGPYTVQFPLSKEEFEFEGERMREQLEWVKGKWVPVQDDDQEKNLMFGVGSQVEVSRDKENYGTRWFVGTILKVIGKSYFLVEYKSLTVGDDRNSELLKEIVDLEYIRPSPPSSPKLHSFNVSDEVEAFHKNVWLVGVVASILPGSRYIVKSKHQNEVIELDKDLLRPHFYWTMKRWAQANKSEGRRVGDKVETSQPCRKSKNVPCSSTSRNDEFADKSGLKNLKNKKAREPHVEDIANLSQPRKKSKKGIQPEDLQTLDSTLKDNAPARIRRKKGVSRGPYKIRKNSDVIEDNVHDPTPSIGQKVFSEANKIPVIAASTRLSPSEEHVIDLNELVPYSTEKALTETDMVPTGLLSNKITLPFTKGSAMWKTVESMEVFCTMPQQPHFQELNNCNMELREGMAIGLMLTFANLVDGTTKLQITDSKEVIERKLEALASLELNGFNVSGVRSLLEKLLVIKCNASQFAAKQVLMEGKIKEKEKEMHQLDLSIAQQNKDILELEISMQRCQEKISLTLTEKNTREPEVSQLKLDLKNAGEAYLSSAMQFKSIINDPW